MISFPSGGKTNKQTNQTKQKPCNPFCFPENCLHLWDSSTILSPILGAKLGQNFSSICFSTELLLLPRWERELLRSSKHHCTEAYRSPPVSRTFLGGVERACGHLLVAPKSLSPTTQSSSLHHGWQQPGHYVLLQESVRITDPKNT